MLACTAPTDRSFWRQDHKDALPQGWGIKAWASVDNKKNPTHPLKVSYNYYPPAGGKGFAGLATAKAAAMKSTSASCFRGLPEAKAAATKLTSTSSSASSSRKPGASKRSSSSEGTSSSEEEEEDESDEEYEDDDHRVMSTTGGDVHSRHPWFKKWLKDGGHAADLLPEQYPKGYDPKRNESK